MDNNFMKGCQNRRAEVLAQQTKRQHILPQHYLKGFTQMPGGEYVWQYERMAGKAPRTVLVKDAAVEGYFYSFTRSDGTRDVDGIERELAQDVEQPAQRVIDKIRDRQMVTGNEKLALALYIDAMLKRVPAHRERVRGMAATIWPEGEQEVEWLVAAQIEKHPDQRRRLEQELELAKQRIAEMRRNPPDWILNVPRRSIRIAQVLAAMQWVFFLDGSDNGFLTSDNPVYYHTHIGIAPHRPDRRFAEVSFPISRDIVLWCTWHNYYVEGFQRANRTCVHEMNRRSVYNATRFVYSHHDADWVFNLTNKKRIGINRLA